VARARILSPLQGVIAGPRLRASEEVDSMNGLMQEQPLNIPMVLRHAEQLHARKK